ncbi:MAG TPA: hypothetical protein VH253_17225 [Phycisphaerae bacterium]|nr:hypothetical protein [Phycisphaerae bacterium]
MENATPFASRRARGSVMILVVAVLGLLAILGTVYVVASRTSRASAVAMSQDANFTFARRAILSQVQGAVGESMTDSNERVGGIGMLNATDLPSSYLSARTYDYPEVGTTFGKTNIDISMRDEPWLCRDLHPQATVSASDTMNDRSVLTAAPFDPSTGSYASLPAYPTQYNSANTSYVFPYNSSTKALSTVVGDQTPLSWDTTLDDPPTTIPDALINLLPFSDGSGIRYRYGVRIIDTNRMANVNTGATDDSLALADTTGTNITSMRLAPSATDMPYLSDDYFYYGTGTTGDGVTIPTTGGTDMKTVLQQSQPTSSPNSGLGRAGTSGIFTPIQWQSQIMQIENPASSFALFDLADELELRSYGEFGTSYRLRLAYLNTTGNTAAAAKFRLWPYTFANGMNSSGAWSPTGGSLIGQPRRRNYTTYSFDRRFRPYVDPKTLSAPNTMVPDYTLLLTTTPTSNTFANQSPDSTAYPLDSNQDTPIFPSNGTVSGNNNRLQPVNVNYPAAFDASVTDQGTSNAMFYVAMTASNLATLMESACSPAPVAIQTPTANPAQPNVFSHDETVQYAANFIAAKTNAMVPDPTFHLTSPNTFDAYYLPAGPSFIDASGMCVRAATFTGIGASEQIFTHGRDFGRSADATKPTIDTSALSNALTGGASSVVCLGYAAQPYINEVAVDLDQQDDPNAPPGPPVEESVVKDWAIELYNPYSVALSLNGYHLKSTAGGDLDLTGNYIPPSGYLVILEASPPGSGYFAGTSYLAAAANLFDPTKGAANSGHFRLLTTTQVLVPALGSTLTTPATTFNLTLYRPYFSRGNNTLGSGSLAPDLAPVDHWDNISAASGQLLDPNNVTKGGPDDKNEFSIQRGNGNPWGATVTGTNTRVAGQTLGQVNTPSGNGVPLYDRYSVNVGTLNGASFANINEFNQLMRVCHIFSAASVATPTLIANGLLEDRLPTLSATTTPYDRMDLPIDSQLHFNFFAPPVFFNTTPTSDPYKTSADVPSGYPKPGDIRAVHLLDQISFIDRQSDGVSAQSLGLTNTIDKLRIPGRININTASGDVLRAVPAIQLTTTPNQTVANMLAYRDRLVNSDPRAKYPLSTGTAASTDYSDHLTTTSKYPGVGFRSMAEALNVLAVPSATDLQTRDAVWAAAYNLCTVRSDTFVVYGYMEAVRANPAFTAHTFDNAADWYGAVTDDPHDTNIANIPLLRVAQRRWVAIIDRSFCNYDRTTGSFTLPKVVAIKDLPQ